MAAVIDVISGWYRIRAARRGHPKGQGGAVAVWQMAGSAMNLNPPLHAAVIDGVYCWDDALQRLVFHRAQRPTKRIMERLVREIRTRVEAILDEHGLREHVDLDEEDGQLALQVVSVQGGGAGRVRGAAEAWDWIPVSGFPAAERSARASQPESLVVMEALVQPPFWRRERA